MPATIIEELYLATIWFNPVIVDFVVQFALITCTIRLLFKITSSKGIHNDCLSLLSVLKSIIDLPYLLNKGKPIIIALFSLA